MKNSYWNGTGRHQKVADKLGALTPDLGYTSSRWLNAFICLSKLYYDYYNNGGGNIEDCYMDEVSTYIMPLFPAFQVSAFVDGDEKKMEQQMDIVLNILGRVSDADLQPKLCFVWFNDTNNLMTIQPFDGIENTPGWTRVSFGTEQSRQDWCRIHLSWGYWMYDPNSNADICGIPFRLGEFDAVFRKTDFGLTLSLSKDGITIPALHLMTKDRRLGDAHWTDVSVGVVRATSNPSNFEKHNLPTPDNLPTVYRREDGSLYCRKCHCVVPNTANAEMRKEGYYSHSHCCGVRSPGEIYED